MADNEKTNETPAGAEQTLNGDQQSVVSRVSNLALVSSACEAVSSAYSSTKDSVPLLKGVMDAAESGVRTLGAAACMGSKPLLDIIEPQLTTVNEYAIKGLEKMEQNLPILHQPADKVVSNTMGAMYQSVAGAKDAVMEAMFGGVQLTRAAVSGGINTVMSTRMGQMVSSGMNFALSRSEDWVDQNLPLTEKELAALAEPASCEETTSSGSPNYFVRLGKLSTKVQERALELSLIRARRAKDSTMAAVAQITSTIDLFEKAKSIQQKGLTTESYTAEASEHQLLQNWAEWNRSREDAAPVESQPETTDDRSKQLEWRALAMMRGLSDQLRSASSGVVSSAQGLPAVVQDQLTNARRSAEELHSSLGNTSSITPVLLERSRHHVNQVQQSLEGVVEYLMHNTPLNWLVGPFAPQLIERTEEDDALEKPRNN